MDQYLLIDLVKALCIVSNGWLAEDKRQKKVFDDAHAFVYKHGKIFAFEQLKDNLEKEIKELKKDE